tara:strand:+ start:320 stop:529 length:210 start_codon:yes stop_codon:yes gene_type:complete
MERLLSDDELFNLTGYKKPKAQKRWLDAQGINAPINAKGKVVTTWWAVNHPIHRGSANDDTPNFEALEG